MSVFKSTIPWGKYVEYLVPTARILIFNSNCIISSVTQVYAFYMHLLIVDDCKVKSFKAPIDRQKYWFTTFKLYLSVKSSSQLIPLRLPKIQKQGQQQLMHEGLYSKWPPFRCLHTSSFLFIPSLPSLFYFLVLPFFPISFTLSSLVCHSH